MAAGAKAASTANGAHPPSKPFELAITLPQSPGTRIHLHITVLASSLMLFLTSASMEGAPAGAAMGSFVYAMPDVSLRSASLSRVDPNIRPQRYNPSQPLSTPLYTLPSSLDFTTRIANVLARKASMPCYVGSSVNLSSAAVGGSVEEEMEAFRLIVEVAMRAIERSNLARKAD